MGRGTGDQGDAVKVGENPSEYRGSSVKIAILVWMRQTDTIYDRVISLPERSTGPLYGPLTLII